MQDHILEAFRQWLNQYPSTSVDAMTPRIHDLRKTIIKAVLALYQVDKLKDLPSDNALDLAKALGLTVPGPVEPQHVDFASARDRLNAKREEMQAKRVARWKMEMEADKRGELFTVVAAYKPESTFLVIYQGLMSDDWHEAFLSQHTDAHMFLDRSYMVGKFGAIRSEAVRIHTGKSQADVTVRVILKKTTN